MIVNTVDDLHQVSGCPMNDVCESCGSTEELNLETLTNPFQGVFCITLCDPCTASNSLPRITPVRAANMVLEHCGHLGITADRMDDLLHRSGR